MAKRIAILGAGITGLACAWKLLQLDRHAQVDVYEREARPGGLAKTIEWNGYRLDLGPHRFHTEIPEIRVFVRQFCESQMVWVKRQSRMFLNGRLIPYPIKPLPTMKALGFARSVRFGCSALGTLLPNKSAARSYEEYVCRYYGRELYEAVFEPLARKVWGLHPDALAAETARVRLRGDNVWQALLDGLFSRQQTYLSEFLYPEGGIGTIAQRFADQIAAAGGRIHLEQPVERLNLSEKWLQTNSGEYGISHYDYLVSTLPVSALSELVAPSLPEPVLDAAHELRYRSIVLLYLLYENAQPIDDTWLYFPEADVPFSRIYVPDNFKHQREPGERTCYCAEFTCEAGDETWQASAQELADQAHAVLQRAGLVERPPLDVHTEPIRYGYPIYHVGYEQSLQTVLDCFQQTGNLVTAGRQGLFRHNNIDQAMQMGLMAAETIEGGEGAIQDWYRNASRFNDYRIVD